MKHSMECEITGYKYISLASKVTKVKGENRFKSNSKTMLGFTGLAKLGNIVAETLLRKHCCGGKCFPV